MAGMVKSRQVLKDLAIHYVKVIAYKVRNTHQACWLLSHPPLSSGYLMH